MKKIIIRLVDNRLICFIGDVLPRFLEGDKDGIVASFDVSEINLHF